jgi:hypothetical protein
MKLINVYTKDTCLEFEMMRSEVQKVVTALQNAKLEYDGNKPEEKEAVEYVSGTFFPMLSRILEDVKDGPG